MQARAAYWCPYCGERITTSVDTSAASRQQYVEDCPVCCRPALLTIDVLASGRASISAEPE